VNILIVSANKEDNLGDLLIYESIKGYLSGKGALVSRINYRLQYYDLNKGVQNRHEGDKNATGISKIKENLKRIRALYLFLQICYFFLKIPFYFNTSKERYKSADIVIIGGGQLIMDTRYSILFPLNLLFHICLAKLYSKKVLFLGIGVTPKFNFLFTEWVVQHALKYASGIMVRDVYSFHRVVKLLGESKKVTFSIDLAVLYPRTEGGSSNGTIGISTLPYYDARYFPISDEVVFEKYKKSIRECCDYIKSNTAHDVRLIPTTRIDAVVAREIYMDCVDESGSINELISKIDNCSAFIATRMHSFIIAVLLGKPALCFYWDNKIKGFISSFCGFDIDTYIFDESSFDDVSRIVGQLISSGLEKNYNIIYHKARLERWIDKNVFSD